MTIRIEGISTDEFQSRFKISGIPDEKKNDFQVFLGNKIGLLGVEYNVEFLLRSYVGIYYPTRFFGLVSATKYHTVYLNWILEWIKENNN